MNSSFSIAVHALVYLNHMERVLSSEELAQNVCTNPVLVRKVMSKLKKAGIVTTKGGKSGGYAFASDAETLTLETIARRSTRILSVLRGAAGIWIKSVLSRRGWAR